MVTLPGRTNSTGSLRDRHGGASVFGIEIDQVRMSDALELVNAWLQSDSPACRYIVTPNVNHVVAIQENAKLKQAYETASMVVADGWPVVAAARLLGANLPERVAGSDLAPSVFQQAERNGRPLRVFLLGGMPGIAERAASRIESRWGCVKVVGVYGPSKGFEDDAAEQDKMLERVNAKSPDFLVVGLGAPKQELWLADYHERLCARVAIAAGATIDFLAGEQTRAPRFVRRLGMEWLFRIGTDPARLAKRYVRDGLRFPPLVARELLARWRAYGRA